ncbi:TPA: hypothetical protein RQN15_001153 [Aeromonas hydrophila]|nr:hypothetical protein [Aeromonas hydrophila]
MMGENLEQENIIVAQDYFLLANKYFDVYQVLSGKIQDPTVPLSEKEVLYVQSEPVIQQAYELQRLGFKALTLEINIPINDLLDSVNDAVNTVKDIYRIGKVIEVVADLIAIAAIVTVPVIKPVVLATLPALVEELRKDVKELNESA